MLMLPSSEDSNRFTVSLPLLAGNTSRPFIVSSSLIISILILLSSATRILQPAKSSSFGMLS